MGFIHASRMLIGYSIIQKIALKRRNNSFIKDSKRCVFDVMAISKNKGGNYYSEKKYEKMLQINDNERKDLDSMHQGLNAFLQMVLLIVFSMFRLELFQN